MPEYDQNSVKAILMSRDGDSDEEAQERIDEAQSDINELLDNDGGLCEAEDIISDHFGLEPDYLMDFLG